MKKIKSITIVGILLGIAFGYSYWYFYSCDHGCAITSSWWKTSGFGGLFGYLLGDSIVEWKEKKAARNN